MLFSSGHVSDTWVHNVCPAGSLPLVLPSRLSLPLSTVAAALASAAAAPLPDEVVHGDGEDGRGRRRREQPGQEHGTRARHGTTPQTEAVRAARVRTQRALYVHKALCRAGVRALQRNI